MHGLIYIAPPVHPTSVPSILLRAICHTRRRFGVCSRAAACACLAARRAHGGAGCFCSRYRTPVRPIGAGRWLAEHSERVGRHGRGKQEAVGRRVRWRGRKWAGARLSIACRARDRHRSTPRERRCDRPGAATRAPPPIAPDDEHDDMVVGAKSNQRYLPACDRWTGGRLAAARLTTQSRRTRHR